MSGHVPSSLSKTSSTSQCSPGLRSSPPAKRTSSGFSARSSDGVREPAAQTIASAMFDFPEPFGPTMTATPGSSEISIGSGNDLKPRMRSVRRCTERHSRRTAGRSSRGSDPGRTRRLQGCSRSDSPRGESDPRNNSDAFRNDAERLEGLAGGLLLGGLLRRAATHPELLPGDLRGAHEPTIVWRPLDLEHGVVHLLARARESLLELGLVVDMARSRVLDALPEGLDDRGLDLLEAVLEVDGGDRRLEDGRENVPGARDPLQLVLRRRPRVLDQP